jgi:hypothetical protein
LDTFYSTRLASRYLTKRGAKLIIPTESLAIGPAMRWLALALSGVFVFAVAVTTAGDVIFKRLQRAALKRELNKMQWHKLVPAILLSFALLNSQIAFAQSAPAPKVTRAEQYSKLLTVVSRIMVQLKKTCTTEQCAALSEEGVALVADGQPKAAKGWLIEEERLNFHDKLESLLTRTIAAIQSRKTAETAKLRLPDGSTCRAKNVVFDQDRCDLCYEVFEQAAEICALYLGVCETCSLICLSVATLQFGHCLKEFCGGA